MVEGAALEKLYGPKAHRGFESHLFRQIMKILILYTSTGLGHKKIAENIGGVLSGQHEVDLKNLFDVEPGALVDYGQRIYFWILSYWPELWDFFYTNRIFLKLTLPLRTVVAGFKAKRVQELLKNNHYDFVISTHTNASAIVSYLKQKGLYNGKFVIAFSDFHLHPYWLYDNADYYLANIDEQKEEMINRGVAGERIAVCGITLPEPTTVDAAAARLKFGLNEKDKVILIMAGSRGTGMYSETVAELQKTGAHLFVFCGTNEKIKQSLQKQFGANSKIHIIGWSDNLAEYYAVADIAVTKPGGLTIAECLLHGLPALISHYLPGQERMNLEYLTDRQLVMPELVDLYGIAADELQTGIFRGALKSNPNVSVVVQHGSTVKAAISGL